MEEILETVERFLHTQDGLVDYSSVAFTPSSPELNALIIIFPLSFIH